jgi:hypothetical protein
MWEGANSLLYGDVQFFYDLDRGLREGTGVRLPQTKVPILSERLPFIMGLLTDWGRLFFMGHRLEYPREEVFRVLMKRLHQSYSDILRMPLEMRDYLFYAELDEIKRENEANK